MAAMETVCPAKLKIFAIWPFAEKNVLILVLRHIVKVLITNSVLPISLKKYYV